MVPRRALGPVAGLVLAVAVLLGALAGPAGATVAGRAQNDAPSVPVPRIIPGPNDGKAPTYDTDPGGSAQALVFWVMCGGLLVIVGLVVLESRRKLRARGEADDAVSDEAQTDGDPTRSSTRSEPVADTSAKSPESSALQ